MKKLTYNYVKNKIELANYKLLSNKYINSRAKLKVQCDKGHIYKVKWDNFHTGKRCALCINNNIKLTYKHVKEQIRLVEGYKLLSKKYINSITKLKVQCNKKHIYNTSWSNFNSGCRCPHCAGLAKRTYKYVKNYIENEGYKLISNKYINTHTNLEVQCNKGHNYKVTWDNFQTGQRCPNCYRPTSKGEKEVLSLVTSLTNQTVIPNDRTQIINFETSYSLELDIWIPSLKKAIEYNGEYWHSLPYQQHKDKIKVSQCQEKNIDLLVINESDWNINKKQCVDNIKDFINIL